MASTKPETPPHKTRKENLRDVIKQNNESLDSINERLNHLTHQLLELQQQMLDLGQVTKSEHFRDDALVAPPLNREAPRPKQTSLEHPACDPERATDLKHLFESIQQETIEVGDALAFTQSTNNPHEIDDSTLKTLAPLPLAETAPTSTQPLGASEKQLLSISTPMARPVLIEPPVETKTTTSWYGEASNYDVNQYVNRVVKSLHNFSDNQNQAKPYPDKDSISHKITQLNGPRPEVANPKPREFTPVAVPPESCSRLLAMRELANAATGIASRLSEKRRKFTFWIRSISGLTALTGCFIWVAFSQYPGDFPFMIGSLLTILGFAAGIFTAKTPASLFPTKIPQTRRSKAILKSARS